jgi:iron complex outermembrane receptor protein
VIWTVLVCGSVAFADDNKAKNSKGNAEAEKKEQQTYQQMSLEDLLNVEVYSVSRRPQELSDTAAAVYVLTQEDIRRSGAKNIPEALRMVPGLHVAQVTSNSWAISSRGFNSDFADKMLVQMDGRTAYTPLFSGVYWDVQDTMIQDIERIEIIRGPGGSLWGANAVNGVINIITKKAQDTQGGALVVGSGVEEPFAGSFRYGGKMGETAFYRVYLKGFSRDASARPDGEPGADDWRSIRSGFRLDWGRQDGDSFTIQGDLYDGTTGVTTSIMSLEPPFMQLVDDESQLGGLNVIGRWTHAFSPNSETVLQVYYDRSRREEIDHTQVLNTYDLDFQHRLGIFRRHELLWGLAYRRVDDQVDGTFTIRFDPPERVTHLASAFVQDVMTFDDNRWQITLGAKLEDNSYTGLEVLPNARVRWNVVDRHSIWGGVSRSVRLPSRANRELTFLSAAFPGPGPLLNVVGIVGNENVQADELLANELGYRFQASDRLGFGVTGFYYIYSNMITPIDGQPELAGDPSNPYVFVPQLFANVMEGETYGLELSSTWSVVDRWRLSGWYAWFEPRLQIKDRSRPVFDALDQPEHQAHLRSYLDITKKLSVDALVYYVDTLAEVPSFVRFDANLTWRPIPTLEVIGGVRNLFDDQHLEFISKRAITLRREIERDVFVMIAWRI